ncbi:MAG: ABC-2 transporter permease [Lachnospiraceae bacterium]|jgi:hypothetical protein|nr:ABC-2 transporter permease [Lachnospiraceae bacterium]
MKGLVLKDFLVIAKQKKLAVMYVFVALMLSFSMDSSFIVSYFSLIGSLLVLTTLSYDSFDNGYPFLMTLPVDAKTYIYAKYCFSFLGLLLFWAFSILLQFGSLAFRKEPFDVLDTLGMDVAFLPAFLIIVGVMLPISLKFGPEKGRIILIVIFGLLFTIAIMGKKILETAVKDLHIDFEAIIKKLDAIPQQVLALSLAGLGILVFLISMAISIGIMKKKEY